MTMTPEDVLAFCRDKEIKTVDLRFMDFPGLWKHLTIPASRLSLDIFEDGLGFDGSSIRGWKTINESDMLIVPQSETCAIDPFFEVPTISLICNIQTPITHEDYSRDPRNVARKAVNYLQSTGIGDTCYVGAEAEFYILDEMRFDYRNEYGYFHVDSQEGVWNRGRNEKPNLANKIRHEEGYCAMPPADQSNQLRNKMLTTLIECGLSVEAQHHETGGSGQAEIDLQYNELVTMADQIMMFKYVVKNVARRHNKVVTFMPKPLYGDAGSGMHTHLSLWKDGQPLFAGHEYAGLSEKALYAIGGIIKHAAALCAFTNPTTNSYKRLLPGFEAPTKLAYSQQNRSATIRIPMYSQSPKSKRIEFRTPDPSSNPYLAFAAILMAMIDGIQNKIDPGDPLDKDIYDLPPEELVKVPHVPASLEESLAALRNDHAFLLRGDAFTADVIDTWIWYKMENEVNAVNHRPHPYEFCLYADI